MGIQWKKVMIGVAFAAFLTAHTGMAAEVSEQKEVLIAKDTVIQVKSAQAVDSSKYHKGDVVLFRLSQDFLVDGKVIILRETEVYGTIAEAKSGRAWGFPGEIKIAFSVVTTESGEVIPVTGLFKKRESEPNFFVRTALLGGLVKGKKAVIDVGAEFSLNVEKDTLVLSGVNQ